MGVIIWALGVSGIWRGLREVKGWRSHIVVKEMADNNIIQARDSGIDDAGEGLFAKRSLKQVGCTPSILSSKDELFALMNGITA